MALKKFILKILIFILAFIGVYWFFIDKLSRGYVDEYYNKFTQEAGGLIIGISRANIGISPYVLEEELKTFNFEKPIVNFAVNSHQSAFGKVYNDAIKNKLKSSSGKSLFILSINPGSFSALSNNEKEIIEMDNKTIIGKTKITGVYPNYNYIINNYSESLYNTFNPLKSKHQISHSNGWNEILLTTKNHTITNNTIKYWKSLTIKRNKKRAKTDKKSQYRINSFIDLIELLKKRGSVFILRMPADKDIIKFENDVWPSFDRVFDSIAKVHKVPYLNYSQKSHKYKTYDGSHLESESAKKFTHDLSEDIKALLNQNK